MEVEACLYYGAADKVISPLPVALVEGRCRAKWYPPGTTDALGARKAKVLNSRSRCTKAANRWPSADGVVAPKNPMDWRRLRSSMGSSPEPAVPAYSSLRMSRKRLQVLGVDLNRSESSGLQALRFGRGEPLKSRQILATS
jgi:hypothetical protein